MLSLIIMAGTEAIREFTRMLTTSREWITSMVPIRDGVLVAVKQGGG